MTGLEKFVYLGATMVILIGAYIVVRQGREHLRGYRPRKNTFAYNRSMTLINLYSILSGAPIRDEPYEWQWGILGYTEIVSGILLFLWALYILILLIRAW